MSRSFTMFGAALLVLAGTTMPARPMAAGKGEILWDRYGVPHIFAADRESMFYGQGWAQMQAQANLLLQLYGESRGRAAEYRWTVSRRTGPMGAPQRACLNRRRRGTSAPGPDISHVHGRVRPGRERLREGASRGGGGGENRVVLPVTGGSTSWGIRCAPCTMATWPRSTACGAR